MGEGEEKVAQEKILTSFQASTHCCPIGGDKSKFTWLCRRSSKAATRQPPPNRRHLRPLPRSSAAAVDRTVAVGSERATNQTSMTNFSNTGRQKALREQNGSPKSNEDGISTCERRQQCKNERMNWCKKDGSTLSRRRFKKPLQNGMRMIRSCRRGEQRIETPHTLRDKISQLQVQHAVGLRR